MKIQLVYKDRTGGDIVILKSQHTYEKIENIRVEQQYGAPQIIQKRSESNMLHIMPNGMSEEIELTRKNAKFISQLVGPDRFCDYVDESQREFVKQLLAEPKKSAQVSDEPKAAQPRRGRGRPAAAPVEEEETVIEV